MAHPAENLRPATYADLEAVPPHQVAEIIDGTLYVSPRPAPKHAFASSSLGGELVGPFTRGRGGPGGWILLDEPELHLLGEKGRWEIIGLHEEAEKVRAEPFDAIELDLSLLWAPTPPAPPATPSP